AADGDSGGERRQGTGGPGPGNHAAADSVQAQVKRLALLYALVAGCGSPAGSNDPMLHDLEAATRAIDRAIGVQTAFVTAGNIDTGATPAIIAGAILNRVQSEAAGCVTATSSSSDASVHADFGAGCALATASMHAGGTVDAAVTADPAGGIDVTLTLALTVDGEALGGSFVVTTPNGNSFSYAGTLTLDGTTVTTPLVTAGIAAGGATIDASRATANGAALALAALHERFAACYPDGGAATLGALGVTFASDTSQTGSVTLSTGKTTTLPTRAGCPK
ncbi:MAG: hypothetical protein JWM53_2166, partial [bacterium]|nr:hypothetical protein [bacterium]